MFRKFKTRKDETKNPVPSSVERELYFLISRFLAGGPCTKTSQALREELKEHGLLPTRIDWEGKEHERSYDNLVEQNRHISSNHLLLICKRLGPLLDKEIPPTVCGVQSLLGAGSQSLLRTKEAIDNPQWKPQCHAATYQQRLLPPPKNLMCPSFLHVLQGREVIGQSRKDHLVPCQFYKKIAMQGRKLGHLSAVYCVAFDRTGLYIFTGADDALVKIWYALSGRLLATLRGHNSEITDIAVNYENTLLASGSCDKVIRIWCLRTRIPVTVLQGHSGMITSLQFCPMARGERRFLSSTGGDGGVCFWSWNVKTNKFDPKPAKFIERSRAGAQMLCSSFSPGGVFLATGSADHVIRVYFIHVNTPEKICELEAHTDRVDSICYSNNSDRFVSGSKDGTARVWRFERQEWRAIILNMSTTLSNETVTAPNAKVSTPVVTMVSWSLDDSMVITAVDDFSIKVWDSHTGKLMQVLKSHEDEVFVVEHNPRDHRIILTAGHDGHVFLWDLSTGQKLKNFYNIIEGQGHGAVFDCKFSPDGCSFAATDSHGHLLIFSFGSNESYKKIPDEVFFHTDYRPLMRDSNNYVLDEQTQQPPHLMPPPFLVDIDGNPYPPILQRLVPGREHCNHEQLIPQMAVTESGDQEVIGERDVMEGSHRDEMPVPAAAANDGDMLGSRIEQMQREQDERIRREGGDPLSSPPHASTSPRVQRSNSVAGSSGSRVGMRMSGATEGVRQSLENIAQRATTSDIAAWSRRIVVKELSPAVLSNDEEVRMAHAEQETKRFLSQRKKRSPIISVKHESKLSQTKKRQRPDDTEEMENEVTATNRLATRALYDTEEEEDVNSSEWNKSSDSESSEYSDWMADAGTNLEPPKRKSLRQVRRKRWAETSSSDDDDDDDRDNDSKAESLDEIDNDDEDYQGPRSSETAGTSRPKRKIQKKKAPQPSKKPGRPSRTKRRRQKIEKKLEGIHELPEEFHPPDWLTGVIPRKTPYVPQMGDEIMYFQQGHRLYLKAVQKKNAYFVNPNKNQPWHRQVIREQEFMKIVGIKYETKPPRLCCLKLAFLDPETCKPTSGTFSLKYHDMPDVIDFLVLKQNYDVAMRRKWKPGDRFRSMIDDAWWMGTINTQEPLDPEYPDSMFQCFFVHWDNGEVEKISPWDMEPIGETLPQTVGGSLPVTQEELKSLMYTPKPTEWPACGRDQESERIVTCIEALMEHSIAEPFLTPVDLNAFPHYAIVIEYPIDLSTIKARLENRFYRRVNALQFDVRYISHNADKFNEPGTLIVKSANIITEALLRIIRDESCTNPKDILMELIQKENLSLTLTSDTDSEDAPSHRKRKRSDEYVPRKRIKTERNKDVNSWKDECRELLNTMYNCEDGKPFRCPVNVEELPDYTQIIDHPMDLGTVQERLSSDHYLDPSQLWKDVRLIFSNSKTYNTNKRSRIYAMTLRLSAMFEEKIRDIIEDHKTAKKIPHSVTDNSRYTPKRPTRLNRYNQSYADNEDEDAGPSSRPGPSSSRVTRIKPIDSEEDQEVEVENHHENKNNNAKGKSNGETHYDSETELEEEEEEEEEGAQKEVSDSDTEPITLPQKSVNKAHRKKSSSRKRKSSDRAKKSQKNGELRYSTRRATGKLKKKRYSADGFITDEKTDTEDSNFSSTTANSSSLASSSNSSSSGSSSSSSSSSSESDSDDKDTSISPVLQRRSTHRKGASTSSKSSVKPKLKATPSYSVVSNSAFSRTASTRNSHQNLKTPSRSKPRTAVSNGFSQDTRKTRNQGKQTIRYHDDSDEDGEEFNDENEQEEQLTMSSRGRVRRPTAKAKASLRMGR